MILKNKIEIDKSVFPKDGRYIDWNKCEGLELPFICNGSIHGKLKLKKSMDENNNKFLVEFNGRGKIISRACIQTGTFVDLVINAELIQLYKLGEIVTSKIKPYRFKITNYGVRNNNGKESIIYQCKCSECGELFYREQLKIKLFGCPHCTGLLNNITKSAPWMIDYFQGGYDEAKKYNRSSDKTIFPKCPDCGEIKRTPVKISTLYLKGLNCKCNTKTYFTERFVSSILDQLGIEYIFQPSAKFLGFEDSYKRYDFYISKLSLIIEVHGLQHYENIKRWNKSEVQLENDKYKKNLSIKNGIKHYVELDCRYSTKSWIEKSIMNSELPKLLNFKSDDINWWICSHHNISDLGKQICEDYKNNYMTVSELANKYDLGRTTIITYLRRGNEYNLCIYNKDINTNKMPIEMLKDGKHFVYFINQNDAVKNGEKKVGLKLTGKSISSSIKNNKLYKGYTFRIVDDIPLRWEILQGNVS